MDPNNKVHELIEKRWSPRAFDSREIEREKLWRIFEAARRAPSSFNEQPWRFIVGEKQKGETWNKVFSVLTESNQRWTINASVLGLIVGKSNFTKNDKPNKHKFYDPGQAAAFLTFQATAEDLYVHQMAGFSPEEAVKVFNIPAGYEPVTAFALGYIGKPDILPEDIRKMEEKKLMRKELSEIIFSEWEIPFKF
ncbi:MAG: nitroreductase family protein [Cytophagaceae bacterium]|nr:nitroreductase family protein [Cytophagaceae bacterium]